jgi:hypothetical protein
MEDDLTAKYNFWHVLAGGSDKCKLTLDSTDGLSFKFFVDFQSNIHLSFVIDNSIQMRDLII